MIAGFLVERLGDTDCEGLRDGLLAQPVNAISSLAFAIVGAWLIGRGWRRPRGRRSYTVVFGLVLASVGAGSVLFHGPQWSGSKWLHDASIAWALAFVVVYDLALARGWGPQRGLLAYWGAAAAIGLVMAVYPAGNEAVVGVLVLLAIGSEFYLRRFLKGADSSPGIRAAYWIAAVAFVLAAGGFLFGRTDSSLCDPDSLVQLHGLWHLLTAVAAAAFAVPLLDRDQKLSKPTGPRR